MSGLLDVVIEDQNNDYFNLTFTQRMLGFATAAILGLFSGFLSIVAIALLRIRKFGILFSIFNLMLLASTGFLLGFKKQLSSIFEQKRYIAGIGMFLGMAVTFFFAFKWRLLIGVIVGFAIEFTSFAYYALSYLPWGTQIFRRCFRFFLPWK
jgi:hypothetical protein